MIPCINVHLCPSRNMTGRKSRAGQVRCYDLRVFMNTLPLQQCPRHDVHAPTFGVGGVSQQCYILHSQFGVATPDSSVGIATGFHSKRGQKIFLLSRECKPTLGTIQPPIHWVPASLSPGVKREGREGNRSSLSNAEFKNGEAIFALSFVSSGRSD